MQLIIDFDFATNEERTQFMVDMLEPDALAQVRNNMVWMFSEHFGLQPSSLNTMIQGVFPDSDELTQATQEAKEREWVSNIGPYIQSGVVFLGKDHKPD